MLFAGSKAYERKDILHSGRGFWAVEKLENFSLVCLDFIGTPNEIQNVF